MDEGVAPNLGFDVYTGQFERKICFYVHFGVQYGFSCHQSYFLLSNFRALSLICLFKIDHSCFYRLGLKKSRASNHSINWKSI